MQSPVLQFNHVSKSFDGIFALTDVNFEIYQGECVALVGENGAGKSTLMKILSGVWPTGSFQGTVLFEGKTLSLLNSIDGRRSGISIIHQELCLFPKLTVAENLFLTEEYPYDGEPCQTLGSVVRWEDAFQKAEKLFASLGFDVDPRALIEDLSVAKRQLVEIARAFHHKARILILDEPTSALSTAEIRSLFKVIQSMRGKVTFIYISHKFDEVFELADRIVVLRDGKAVASLSKAETNSTEVIQHMVGRPLKESLRKSFATQKELFRVEGLSHRSPEGQTLLNNIHFKVHAGEVYGICGLMGSGRSELLRSILGVLPGERIGKLFFEGREVHWDGLRDAMKDKVAFVPEDRKKDGLFLNHGIDFNLTISTLNQIEDQNGCLDLKKEEERVQELIKELGVKCSKNTEPVRNLSGGNQQKVLLAKMVALDPKILLLDEPTRGIDVGAKEEIYTIIRALAAKGLSIILVSSELPEILGLSDRVLVLREGKSMGELVNDKLTQEQVMAYAAGEKH